MTYRVNLSLVVLVAALGAVAVLGRAPPPAARTSRGVVLPRPGFLIALFNAQKHLVADYYWIQTTHQIGAAMTAVQMRDVYDYAELATTLDPNFLTVYWFAGVALPIQTGRDQYANVAESTAILQKGARVAPKNYKIKFQLAQNYIHLHKDYVRGAELLKELSTFPEAPDWLLALATRLYAQAGSIDVALQMAVGLANNAEDEQSREFYAHRVKEIQQEMVLRAIDDRLKRYESDQGKKPAELREVEAAGYLAGIPGDPLGGEYYIDQKSGRAMSTASKHRFELIQMKEQASSESAPK